MALAAARSIAAQSAASYALTISQNGNEIGREQVTVRPGRGDQSGTTLVGVARYPATRPRVQLTGTIERASDGTFTTAQFELQTLDHAWRTFVAPNGRRITVRTATEGRESAREYPADQRTVLLDDSLFTPWLAIPALVPDSGTSLAALWPRSARRGTIWVQRTPRADGGAVLRVTGAIDATIECSSDGRVLRIILPPRGVVAAASAP